MRVATDRPVRFDMESLRMFVAVIEEGSIAAASARTHLVASAVSKRVSELESDAGTPLLYRHSRGVQATPAGEALYHHAKRLVEHLQQISDELSEYSEGVRGHARIYMNFTAMVQYLPDALHSFLRANPEVRIDMVEKTSDQVVHAIATGVADLGICSAARGSLAGLEVRPYRTDKLVVLVPADHRLAERTSVRFDETLDDDVVSMPHGTSIHKLCTEAAERSGRRLRVRIEVTSFEGVRNMVAAGLGIGVLPEGSVIPYSHSARFRVVELDEPWSLRPLQIAHDQHRLNIHRRLRVVALLEAATGHRRDARLFVRQVDLVAFPGTALRRLRILATRLLAVFALRLATRHLGFILLLFLLEPFLRPRLDLRLRFGQRLEPRFASRDLRRHIHPVRHTVAVRVLGHLHQLLHFFVQLRFDPADVPVRQRAMLACVRLHLGAVQRNPAPA